MTPEPRLPWPHPWPDRPHPKYWTSCAIGAGLGALLLAGLLPNLPRADIITLTTFSCMGAAVIGLAAMGHRTRIRPFRRRDSDISGMQVSLGVLTVRYSRLLYPLIWFNTIVLGVCAAGIAILGARHGQSGSGGTTPGEQLFMVGGAVAAGAVLVGLAAGIIRPGSLQLSPAGILHQSWTYREFVDWDRITSITAAPAFESWNGGSRPALVIGIMAMRVAGTRESVVREPPRRRERDAGWSGADLEIPTARLATSPALVFWLLRFYHLHPEARPELGTEVALQRIAQGGLGVLGTS